MYGCPSILVVASDKNKQHKLASMSANILSSIYLELSAEWGPLFIYLFLVGYILTHTHALIHTYLVKSVKTTNPCEVLPG